MASNSLLGVLNTPQVVDALPAYTRRDPETSSIRSSAPSYVSEAPTYRSTAPNPARRPTGLPPPTYAPGFHRAHSGKPGDLSRLNFNISEWSQARSGPQARHYQNVASRRAIVAHEEERARLAALATTMTFPNLQFIAEEEPAVEETNPPVTEEPDKEEPHNPLEDPDLVGIEAARTARERRLYMTRCLDDREAIKQENKSWDFMLSQMADWKEREKSWEKFQRDVRKTKVLGRLLR